MARSSKTKDDFIKQFYKKYGNKLKKDKETVKWVADMYNDSKNESVNEAAYDTATRNELAQYIINLSNELRAAKSRNDKTEIKYLEKDLEEVKAALAKKKNESFNENNAYEKRLAKQLGDLRTARRGATVSGGGYGPFTKERDNAWVDAKRTKIYSNDGIQKFIGGFNDFKVKNESVNESQKLGHAQVRNVEKFLSGKDKEDFSKAISSGDIKTHEDLEKWIKSRRKSTDESVNRKNENLSLDTIKSKYEKKPQLIGADELEYTKRPDGKRMIILRFQEEYWRNRATKALIRLGFPEKNMTYADTLNPKVTVFARNTSNRYPLELRLSESDKYSESVNEAYTGNIGDALVHKHYPSIEIELLKPTNKGWKVKATQNGKTKITYFDKQDLVGDKALFEVKSNLKEYMTLGVNGVRRYANKHNINMRAKKQGATIYAILWNDKHDFGVFDTSITTKEELDKKILPKLESNYNEAEVNEAFGDKELLSIYNGLIKGDKINIKYNSSISSNIEKELVVTKGNTLIGSQKVKRITLVDTKNKSGVKYYLYNRNGKVTLAIGDMAASIISLKKSSGRTEKPKSTTSFNQNPADLYNSMMKTVNAFSKPKGFGGFGGGKFGGGGAGGSW